MKPDLPPTPAGAEILQAGGRGGTGNVLYLFRHEQPPLLLKVYRPRRSRRREFMKHFSERFLEGKRGATAAIRCATEKQILDLWAREGFDVIPRVERSRPAGVTLPALWLEYCHAPLLSDVLADPGVSREAKMAWVELLAHSLSRRHTRAMEIREPLLVHEHGQIKHFFARENRLIAFDLEHGFSAGYPVVRAVARELAGIAYSLQRADATLADAFLQVFARAFDNRPLLLQVVAEATRGGGWPGKIRRRCERRRGPNRDKSRLMERLGKLATTPASA